MIANACNFAATILNIACIIDIAIILGGLVSAPNRGLRISPIISQEQVPEVFAHRKEVAELLRFRVRGADALARDSLVQRIVVGPVVSAEIEDPEAVKDAYRWVYLASLDLAIEPLPDAAQNALQSIKNRRQWQDRKARGARSFLVVVIRYAQGPNRRSHAYRR